MRALIILILSFGFFLQSSLYASDPRLKDEKVIYLSQIDYSFSLENAPSDSSLQFFVNSLGDETNFRSLPFKFDSASMTVQIGPVNFPAGGRYLISSPQLNWKAEIHVIPGWLSLLPPFIAILFALLFRQVILSLFIGTWIGVTFIYDYNPFIGFLNTLTDYIGKAPADEERMAILIFSLALGGMVGVISKSGGTMGIVHRLTRFASNRRRGQFATWLMGILIFFDDYANTLIVGNTMRPLTDRLKISREKLSYLVDSTAAPVANIAIISTWIGYQLSLMNDSFQNLGLDINPYLTFFKTIPYNFYPLFTLAFGLFVALTGRDLFSMFKAEKRCVEKGNVLRDGALPLADLDSSELKPASNIPLRWFNAAIPIATVILVTLWGLWFTGYRNTAKAGLITPDMGTVHFVSLVIGNADSFAVLMWASFSGGIVAIFLAMIQKLLNLNQALMAWVSGVKAMVMAAIILVLAWSIGNICTDIQTANYVIYLTRDMLSPHMIPVIAFLVAGIISLSTGTSWGTMAILLPIVIPIAYQLPRLDPTISVGLQNSIFLSSIASILAGATFGDHCSPISDTTIMSSMASGADHVDHVRTQLPYALLTAGVSVILGYLLIGLGVSVWISLVAGFISLFVIIRFFGKRV
ncbi:MAG: Na+/H+ antiporter NhaC family protein [Calditrichaeota bacterium]|nr:Na+/H+ antiporter NhaC family protein [Calditrichota bacterium]